MVMLTRSPEYSLINSVKLNSYHGSSLSRRRHAVYPVLTLKGQRAHR